MIKTLSQGIGQGMSTKKTRQAQSEAIASANPGCVDSSSIPPFLLLVRLSW